MSEECDRITLNVGGCYYDTTRQTLCKKKNSYFSALVANEVESPFIDRDGTLFGIILNYLRNDLIVIDMNDIVIMRLIYHEAIYYNLDQLAQIMQKAIKNFRVA